MFGASLLVDLSVCSNQQPCRNGATCAMKDSGDFTCLCPQGYHGHLCQRKSGPCHQIRWGKRSNMHADPISAWLRQAFGVWGLHGWGVFTPHSTCQESNSVKHVKLLLWKAGSHLQVAFFCPYIMRTYHWSISDEFTEMEVRQRESHSWLAKQMPFQHKRQTKAESTTNIKLHRPC